MTTNQTRAQKLQGTRNISRFFAMNSLVFSRSRRTGGRTGFELAAALFLLRTGSFTSALESIDLTNSAEKM
jgi:hypothetical protein